ncbi:uncharacterized protein LOC131025969 [Salvia miltiorrhiza]|uniref:uncharacterized protein LOC131025969 n=1 Tax=Salvia miltiorrhiza TaxID=226208 RepID=UPI0025AD4046|nr:uncharacterized protein LOC131025969 [Salvia miltiorrhiza]
MNVLAWNVRGLTDESKRLLWEHCRTFFPIIVGIIEPKSDFRYTNSSFWSSLNLIPAFQNTRHNRCSNIWVFHHPDVFFRLVFSSDQTVIADCHWNSLDFRLALVHGASTHVERRTLWADLIGFSADNMVILWDFNAVKGAHERISSCMPSQTSCREFCDFIDDIGFIESSTSGLRFTWSGRRFMPRHVESFLDRALYSESFSSLWHSVHTLNLARLTSDHSPIVFQCSLPPQTRHRFFRFLNMWAMHPDFHALVEDSWRPDTGNLCPIYKWMEPRELMDIQMNISIHGYTDELFDKEVQAQAKINVALSRKSCLLQQKSRVSWLKDGDRNTDFFHATLRYKHKPKAISQLMIDGTRESNQDKIGDHIVDYFTTLFTDDSGSAVGIEAIEAVIDPVISDAHNAVLSASPSDEEITAAVFNMDADSSPGPDGFSGKFFQVCWSIIKHDIWDAVRTFFLKSYLPTGCNSSTLILIPKKENVISVSDLRPIVLSNFLFKIISKVLASRLSVIAAHYVSHNQFGFISGRSIHDCILMGSEGFNCMKRTSRGQNMACKIDIRKAFDTLRWDFLVNVLHVMGFDVRFIDWIKVILTSARISILYNGKLYGYFGCSRGVRQGDPLSPILFGIAEDVLSALFHNCVTSGHLTPMTMTRSKLFPTHLLYADDILVFCKASVRNAKTIKKILDYYSWISGQICSSDKSHIYFSTKVHAVTKRSILRELNFVKSVAPFTYLGVPIFDGRVRASYFRPIHDRIIAKFSRWRGRLLSMAGRLCLVKSVIQSSITHSMMVYKWPRSLLKDLDDKCRNFIWTGDIRKTPSCSVSWNRVCAIKEEGGLGVRSFSLMNKCFLIKMAWKLICGKDFGFSILQDRYLDIFSQVRCDSISSSVWLGLKDEVRDLVENSYSYIGDGTATNFWCDDWLGYRIHEKCKIPHYILDLLGYSVADYFYDGVWHFTQEFINAFPEIVGDILVLPIGKESDTRYWKPSLHGTVTAALAFANHCHRFPRVSWGSWIWKPYIPVRRSLACWRILHDRLPTYDRLIRHGMIMPNHCVFCFSSSETMDHILWSCDCVRPIWLEFLSWFQLTEAADAVDMHSFFVRAWCYKFSSQLDCYWRAGIITILWAIWTLRNSCIFDNKIFEQRRIIHFVRVAFKEMENSFNLGHMNNSWKDYTILRSIGVATRAAPPPDFIAVHWWPPVSPWIKVNTDGSAMGAPGNIAAGGVFRDNFSWVRGCFHYKGELALLLKQSSLRLSKPFSLLMIGVGFIYGLSLILCISFICLRSDRPRCLGVSSLFGIKCFISFLILLFRFPTFIEREIKLQILWPTIVEKKAGGRMLLRRLKLPCVLIWLLIVIFVCADGFLLVVMVWECSIWFFSVIWRTRYWVIWSRVPLVASWQCLCQRHEYSGKTLGLVFVSAVSFVDDGGAAFRYWVIWSRVPLVASWQCLCQRQESSGKTLGLVFVPAVSFVDDGGTAFRETSRVWFRAMVRPEFWKRSLSALFPLLALF